MNHKNFIGISRKKTANSVITKMEIIPSCCELKETCVTERSIVDVNVKKHCSRSCKTSTNTKSTAPKKDAPKSMDASTEPLESLYYSEKDTGDNYWDAKLKNSKDLHYSRRNYPRYVEEYSNSSSYSSPNSVVFTKNTIYTKNKGIQCDEDCINENNPIYSVQKLLRHIKKKLKGNMSVKRLLVELEMEINRLWPGLTINNVTGTEDQILPKVPFKRYSGLLSHSNNVISTNIEGINSTELAEAKLDATCRELEKTCEKLKKERDTSIKLAADKSAELVETLVREAETKRKLDETYNKVKEMSIKIENYAVSMENLNEHIKRLRKENKELQKLKQRTKSLNDLLRSVTDENKSMLCELQLLNSERNKLQLALTLQEQKLNKKSTQIYSTSSELLGIQAGELDPLRSDVRWQQETNKIKNSPSRQSSADSQFMTRIYSDVASTSPSLIDLFAPSLCKSISVNSVKTPSPSSDHLLQVLQPDNEEEKNEISSLFSQKQECQQPSTSQQTAINYEVNFVKLKEDIKKIFSEVRDLTKNIPTMPIIIDFNFDNDSVELFGRTDESRISSGSIQDVNITDLDTN